MFYCVAFIYFNSNDRFQSKEKKKQNCNEQNICPRISSILYWSTFQNPHWHTMMLLFNFHQLLWNTIRINNSKSMHQWSNQLDQEMSTKSRITRTKKCWNALLIFTEMSAKVKRQRLYGQVVDLSSNMMLLQITDVTRTICSQW